MYGKGDAAKIRIRSSRQLLAYSVRARGHNESLPKKMAVQQHGHLAGIVLETY